MSLADIPHMNRQPDCRLLDFGVVDNALSPVSAQEPLSMSQGAPRQGRWIDLVVIMEADASRYHGVAPNEIDSTIEALRAELDAS